MSVASQSSTLTFFVSFIAMTIYGYCLYFMNTNPKVNEMHKFMEPKLRVYGHLKFLTYQCLCIQFLNSILHVLAHYVGSLQKFRDLVFNSLAYPVGSIVCYSFWAVWFLMGRELIFPKAIDDYYPSWLNHATHSIIIPINLLLAILLNHKYNGSHAVICLAYFGFYTGLLHYIKMKSGVFVYKYLDTMNDTERIVYFAATALIAYVMCRSGNLLSQLVHKKAEQRPALKKTKQK